MVAFKGIWTKDFWRAVSGEYLATLIFVFLGVGSTINWAAEEEKPPPADIVLISLCFGLTIATMVQCFGHIGGGHINPAVTVAMVITRKLSLAKAMFYVMAQCLGAITGAGILYLVTPAALRGSLGVTMVNSKISVGHALLVELIITFELVFTVFATCDPKRTDLGGSAGLAIGFAVAIGHLFAIPYTGASMNPARSFGPAMVTLNFEYHWLIKCPEEGKLFYLYGMLKPGITLSVTFTMAGVIFGSVFSWCSMPQTPQNLPLMKVYWVGPILGGILAAGLYEYLYCPDPDLKKKLKQVLQKDASGKYKEVEAEDIAIKPGSIHAIDLEKSEKKDPFRDSTGEVLSSV